MLKLQKLLSVASCLILVTRSLSTIDVYHELKQQVMVKAAGIHSAQQRPIVGDRPEWIASFFECTVCIGLYQSVEE